MKTVFFSFPGNEELSLNLIKNQEGELGAFELRNFPDGETYLRILTEVFNKKTILVCSLNQPNDKIIPVYLFAKTLKSLGAKEVIFIAPYLAYMRQDALFKTGEGLSSHYMAQLISGCVDKLITVDPHLHRIAQLNEIYAIQTKVVHAAEHIALWIKQHVPKALLIGPDSESEQWVSKVAQQAAAEYTVLSKHRSGDKQVEVSVPLVENYKDHTPVLIDDIISTGRTMIETLLHLKKLNMKPAVCIAIHAVFAGNAYKELQEAGASKIVSCNTIKHESNAIDISELLVL